MKIKPLIIFFAAYTILMYGFAIYLGWKWLLMPFLDINQMPYWASIIMATGFRMLLPADRNPPRRPKVEIYGEFIGTPIGVIILLWLLSLIVPIFT